MKKYKWIIIILNLVILFGVFNYSIYQQENKFQNAKLLYLELAPVDPRSLMQGDYMTLSYAISNGFNSEENDPEGYCVVKVNEDGIAERVRLQNELTPLADEEIIIAYSFNGSSGINIGAESYFFQEGTGSLYENAKYGGVKVDDNGAVMLIGLYNENLKKLE